jgi:hypothetical protein
LARTPKGTYLLYLQEPDLFAVEFDVKAGTIRGTPFVLIPGIGQVASPAVKPALGVSQNGVMAYQAGGAETGIITWFDRAGKSQGTIPVEGGSQWLRFSPNGLQVASRQNGDFWIIDLSRGASTRLTRTGRNSWRRLVSGWKAIGIRVARTPKCSPSRGWIRRSGAVGNSPKLPRGWSADGFIMLRANDLLFQPKGNAKPVTLTNGIAAGNPRFLTRWEILWHTRRAHQLGRKSSFKPCRLKRRIQVSLQRGNAPHWRGDGHELFFLTPEQHHHGGRCANRG